MILSSSFLILQKKIPKTQQTDRIQLAEEQAVQAQQKQSMFSNALQNQQFPAHYARRHSGSDKLRDKLAKY